MQSHFRHAWLVAMVVSPMLVVGVRVVVFQLVGDAYAPLFSLVGACAFGFAPAA